MEMMQEVVDVLKGLECCCQVIPQCSKCGCPYSGKMACKTKLKREASALIKAAYLEPRILTLNELRTVRPGMVLWEMQRDLTPAYPVEFKGFGTFATGKEAIEFGLGFEEVAEYGKQYIIWTAKPTGEQIRSVKWDG